ncbi:unnamed protein product [Dibothriocephalus latus]|uniref:Ku domain-containing protein n=1 Tax=Dibothriocephalus latus TaxID=60516 RepID=A0A3P7P7D8_DIBLA|nr:unnamed protein product [Dibothriocephalus latus]
MFFVADTPAGSSDSGDATSAAFSALAQALFELDAVALVRRVYSRSTAPVLGVLTPRWVGGYLCSYRNPDTASTNFLHDSPSPSLPRQDTEIRTTPSYIVDFLSHKEGHSICWPSATNPILNFNPSFPGI